MDAKVSVVEKVTFHVNRSGPAQLVIVAQGKMKTTGWTEGRLIAWAYIDRPADGILDFDLVAKAPSGIVLQIPSIVLSTKSIVLLEWI